MSRKKNTTIKALIRLKTGLEQDAYLQACIDSGMTARRIARELGVSHTQINNLLRELSERRVA